MIQNSNWPNTLTCMHIHSNISIFDKIISNVLLTTHSSSRCFLEPLADSWRFDEKFLIFIQHIEKSCKLLFQAVKKTILIIRGIVDGPKWNYKIFYFFCSGVFVIFQYLLNIIHYLLVLKIQVVNKAKNKMGLL